MLEKASKSKIIPFVALTETWLKPHITDSQISVPGYTPFRSDRCARQGGGVLLYVHDKLPVTGFKKFDDNFCQALICLCETSKMVVCVLYRPPRCPEYSFRSCLKFVTEYMDGISDEYELSMLGDFNIPPVDWSTNSIQQSGFDDDKTAARILLEFMADSLCCQFVKDPTRGHNILDLFISNSEELVTHVETFDNSLSDHKGVEIFLSYNPLSPESPKAPIFTESSFRAIDFRKADFDYLNSLISSMDWDLMYNSCKPEEFPEIFTEELLNICESTCPKKDYRPPKKSHIVRNLSRKKRKLQRRLTEAESNPYAPNSQIISLRNKVALAHLAIRDAIVADLDHKERLAATKVKENPKYFYSYCKKFSKKKSNISMLFDENKNITTDPEKIANLFQQQFTSVFSNPADTNLTASLLFQPEIKVPAPDDFHFTFEDVEEAIDEIKPDAASGPDEIPTILLKGCKQSLAKPIHMYWAKSMETGFVDSFYKTSIISPVHKKDSRALPENYRPISLTSHIIKIFERVVRKKLVQHLEVNGLICKHQHGFRSKHSCLTQLLHHFDDVFHALANNSDFDSIYLDYAKAFDKVDHRLLIQKLHRYGFSEKIIKWIESFLSNRTQTVVVDGFKSIIAFIVSGVPQGTVLGPVLFLIFINDMDNCILHSIARFFADDTRASKAIDSASDVNKLQEDVDAIIKWSEQNNMKLHKDKFQFISHSYEKNNTLKILPFFPEVCSYRTSETSVLLPVNQVTDLGILVSEDLSWSPHISEIALKARLKAGWVLSVFRTRLPDIMLMLFKSMVRSLGEYCCPLWNPVKVGDIQELESVQKTFTAKIAGLKELNYWERLDKLNLMSLQRRRERFVIMHMFKILNEQISNDLGIQFVRRPRLGNLAKIPPVNKHSTAANRTLYENSFAVRGPKLWNAIPYKLNTITDINTFKKKLTKFMLMVPDTPPVKGYSPQNSNSLLCWKDDKQASKLWGVYECDDPVM